jgi:mono/diheme cytochrome c family protein
VPFQWIPFNGGHAFTGIPSWLKTIIYNQALQFLSGYLHPNPLSSGGFVVSAGTQSPGPDDGRHLAETVCSACHQIDANAEGPGPNPRAPNFVDISRMPSMSKLAIRVFLRSPHPSMPNIILSSKEIDSIAAYIHSLDKK